MNTFGFRTLVLALIAGALMLATALLGWLAYATVYQQILAGFDRKLLGISGTVAALTDGNAHADYQQPHRLTHFVSAGPDQAWAWEANRRALVRIDLLRSAVIEYREWAEPPHALFWIDDGARLLVLRADGALLEANAPSIELARLEASGLWVSDGESLYRYDGAALHPVTLPATESATLATVPIQLAAAVDLLAYDRERRHWLGWQEASTSLLRFDAGGQLLETLAIDPGDHRLVGIAPGEQAVLLAADEMLRVVPPDPALIDEFEPGWYDEEHPFFARHAPMYRSLRERVGLTFLYTEVYIGGDRIRYILDGSVGDDHSPPGYLDSVPDADIDAVVRAQVEGTPFVSGIRQWEAWGLVKVSAAPILDRDGRIVALAGADVDIGVIRTKTRNALFAVLGVGVALLLASGLVSLWVAQSINRPLREIKHAALKIAAGQYGARVNAAAADDIGRLAGSLDRLSLRLQEQSRASSASQSALLNGRLDGALHASLDTAQDHPRLWWMAHAGGRFLLLDGEARTDEVDRAEHRGMLRALVRRMAGSGIAGTELLLAADPELQLVLDWRPRERRLRWSGRNRFLIAVYPDGSRQPLPAGSVQIPTEVQVCLDDGLPLLERGAPA